MTQSRAINYYWLVIVIHSLAHWRPWICTDSRQWFISDIAELDMPRFCHAFLPFCHLRCD